MESLILVQNLVQNDRRYLLLRGATYYFRFPAPTHARRLVPSLPREVKRSLKTDSLSQARALVGQKLLLIRLIYQCCDKQALRDLYDRLLDFTGGLNQWVEEALRGVVSGDASSSDQLLIRQDCPSEGVGVLFSDAWNVVVY